MNKTVRIKLSPEAEETYHYLESKALTSKIERSILNAFHQKKEFVKNDIHYGDPVAKHLIPGEYIQKYGVVNLFRVELSNYWRMTYTLIEGETEMEIIAFVLDIMDHKVYDKKFGYR